MSPYKYWSTKKLRLLLNELSWREKNVATGVSDIEFKLSIEDILFKREVSNGI
jgi:hypothetical protein